MLPRGWLPEEGAVCYGVVALRVIDSNRLEDLAGKNVVALISMALPDRPVVDADAGKPVARVASPRHDAAEMRDRRVDACPLQIGRLQGHPSALAQNRRLQFVRGVKIAS